MSHPPDAGRCGKRRTALNRTEPSLLALVTAAQAGDLAAREALVERFQPLIRSLCRGWPDYEEHYQETVCQFLELLRDYDLASPVYFGHYIKVKLGWRVRNYRRLVRRRTRPEAPFDHADHIVAAAPDLAERLDIQAALQSLSDRQRDVVVRSYWRDEEPTPIARDLGVSVRAVRALRLRAIRRLAEVLSDDRIAQQHSMLEQPVLARSGLAHGKGGARTASAVAFTDDGANRSNAATAVRCRRLREKGP